MENPSGAKFCMSCGKPLVDPRRKCPVCQSIIPDEAKMCPNCGVDLKRSYLILSDEEISPIQRYFRDAGIKSSFTTSESIQLHIPKLHSRDIILGYIPVKGFELVRESVALESVLKNEKPYSGAVILTNRRVVYGIGATVETLEYGELASIAVPGMGFHMGYKVKLEMKTKDTSLSLTFLTPSQRILAGLFTLVEDINTPDLDRQKRNQRGSSFDKGIMELYACFTKRWN
jgi:RNA polymerase subunit RPABC4/transcription elongation factor Spt4